VGSVTNPYGRILGFLDRNNQHLANKYCYLQDNMLLRKLANFYRIIRHYNAYRLLVGKPEGKRPLGRPRYRWVDNIRMDLGEVGWGDVDWIGLAQDRNRCRALVNSVVNLRVP
jgi:hypothetical protein